MFDLDIGKKKTVPTDLKKFRKVEDKKICKKDNA